MSHPFNELSESELDGLVAKERARTVTPLVDWQVLASQLRDEGLVGDTRAQGVLAASDERLIQPGRARGRAMDTPTIPVRKARAMRWGMRVFASVALMGIGVVVGRAWDRGTGSADIADIADASSDEAQLVTHEFLSPDQALQVLNRAQDDYQQAAAYLSVHNDASVSIANIPDLRERLAALDAVVSAAQNAMNETPHDPLLKQYYMSSSGARQATLQLLRQNLPDGTQLAGY